MDRSLDRFGYQVLEKSQDSKGYFNRVSAKKEGKFLFFQMERLAQSFLDTYLCHIKLVGRSQIDIDFTVRNKNRDYHSRVREEGIIDDYFVESTYNHDEILRFLNNDRIFPQISKLIDISIDGQLTIRSMNGKFMIRLTMDCDFTRALAAIPILETLEWVFEIEKSFQQLIIDLGSFQCQNCGGDLTYKNLHCDNCGASSPKCVICLKDPDPTKPIMQLVCCKSYAHKNELNFWLEIRSACPYCASEDVSMLQVE